MNYDTNLVEEILDHLRQLDKKEKDILWVGNSSKRTSWPNFKRICNINYDPGFGCNVIELDFMVVGEDWWLERYEYDGSEGFHYKTYPTMPTNTKFKILDLICVRCSEKYEIQKKDEE